MVTQTPIVFCAWPGVSNETSIVPWRSREVTTHSLGLFCSQFHEHWRRQRPVGCARKICWSIGSAVRGLARGVDPQQIISGRHGRECKLAAIVCDRIRVRDMACVAVTHEIDDAAKGFTGVEQHPSAKAPVERRAHMHFQAAASRVATGRLWRHREMLGSTGSILSIPGGTPVIRNVPSASVDVRSAGRRVTLEEQRRRAETAGADRRDPRS